MSARDQEKQGRKLLFSVTREDCDWTYMPAGGPGGQHQNKTSTACRVIHRASGAVGESREHRSREQNRKAAFLRMVKTEKFEKWRRLKAARLMGQPSPEELAERAMHPSNLKVEGKDEQGRWVEVELPPEKEA